MCGVRAGSERKWKRKRGRDVLSEGGVGVNTDEFCVQDGGTSCTYTAPAYRRAESSMGFIVRLIKRRRTVGG